MIQRSYYQLIKRRVEEPRRFIQVLYGPRQVGKTTLIKQVLETVTIPHLFVTADDITGAGGTWLRQHWSEARRMCAEHDAGVLFVVDEVQKIENWSETVKKEWDTDSFHDRHVKLVLLGSSSLLIQRGLTESLAGRFESIYIPHWSFAEMEAAFGWSVEQYIWFGGYPGAAGLTVDEKRWKSYIKNSLIETSLSRDILMLTRIGKPALLRRLFEIGSVYTAQILSLNKVQGELNERGNLTTLSGYLEVLKSAGLLCGVEKYAGDIIRKRASKPKFQVFNNGLASAQNEKSFMQAISDRKLWGRMFESAVGAHLLNNSYTEEYGLYYWNENSAEVDFIIEKGGKTVAIEVKSGKDPSNSGMAIFESQFHPVATYLVGTEGIPIEEFLKTNPMSLF